VRGRKRSKEHVNQKSFWRALNELSSQKEENPAKGIEKMGNTSPIKSFGVDAPKCTKKEVECSGGREVGGPRDKVGKLGAVRQIRGRS